MARLKRAAVIVAGALAACTAGCETLGPHSCDTSLGANPYVSYTQGSVAAGVYMSSPWNGPLLLFDGGTHYKLYHGLGATPRWWVSYLSFDESGTGDGGDPIGGGGAGGSGASPQGLAQAAGNEAVVLGVDACTIEIENDSCVSSWLLVTAGGAAPVDGGAMCSPP